MVCEEEEEVVVVVQVKGMVTGEMIQGERGKKW